MLAGCSNGVGKRDIPPGVTEPDYSDPNLVLQKLSVDKTMEISSFISQVKLPDSIPNRDQEFRDAYLEWYRKGYAFAFITGTECLRDQLARDGFEKSKMDGWFDGNRAGSLAWLKKELERKIITSNTNKP